MAAIHVRNVPEHLMIALRERAARHGHSMQQEIMEVLQMAAAELADAEEVEPLRLITTKTSGRSTWRREDVYDDEAR
jgi:plasmid stability protein